MEDKLIQADSNEPIREHKLFRGIMLSFLFSLIVIGTMSLAFTAEFGIDGWKQINRNAFAQGGFIEPFKVQEVKEALEIDDDIIVPTDGFQYGIKLFREAVTEFFTFDKSDRQELNIKLIDERAKEIAILDARGDEIPNSVVKSYGDRIDRAERFISLQTDDNENIDARTVVRSGLEVHKIRFLDKIQALQDQSSESRLTMVVQEFGDRIVSIVSRIDIDEVAIVKNTIPIVKQLQVNIKLAEMVGDVDTVKREMAALEEIDDKLNRLHLASLCPSPIKTLAIATFEDIQLQCPIAVLIEEQIRDELEN